ncbi:G-type lectin S-receptor-like serine/threonine-protein kinase [Acorus calamus]|uniref:non-specific serine/threonine protein kinase n=1 Tax=Acorus calamus TaxID=4465 RepID=A0AAV9CI34_ACOCL|nr:G-type lectin S-receptor-like serine/threonine-protein kinase [Acorus calamus]
MRRWILTSFNASDSPWLPTQNKILISPSRTFTAGFLPSSGSFIFSIFYTSFNKTVVWSSSPVSSSSPLSISPSGVLSLNNTSWTVPSTSPPNPQLTLRDSGELIFANWSSFKFPTDTILPEQIIPPTGKTLVNGKFSLVNATSLVFGPNDSYWSFSNNNNLVALLNLTSDGSLTFQDGSILIAADVGAPNRLRRLTLGPDGNLKVYSVAPGSGNWTVVWRAIQERCTIHGTCGTGSICATIDGYDNYNCLCPPGFDRASDGQSCRRRIPLTPADDKFLRLDFVKFADGATPLSDPSALNFEGCRSFCARNTSCVAFGYSFSGSQSCVLNTQLVNGYWSPATELATFLRVSWRESATSNFTGMSTKLETTCPVRIRLPVPRSDSNSTTWNLAIICSLFAVELLAGVFSFYAFLKKYSKYRDMARTFGLELLPAGGPKRFTFAELKSATKDFSDVVGHGGFGIVYRGELPDHRIVAREPITAKADVYSFGMVLLEIVSGIRNFDFRMSTLESEDWYFPKYAYEKVYRERKMEEILDKRIMESYDGRVHGGMVERMVKTAMWCLQDRPEARPSMGKVAKMLEGLVEITEPGRPTIFYLNEEE